MAAEGACAGCAYVDYVDVRTMLGALVGRGSVEMAEVTEEATVAARAEGKEVARVAATAAATAAVRVEARVEVETVATTVAAERRIP